MVKHCWDFNVVPPAAPVISPFDIASFRVELLKHIYTDDWEYSRSEQYRGIIEVFWDGDKIADADASEGYAIVRIVVPNEKGTREVSFVAEGEYFSHRFCVSEHGVSSISHFTEDAPSFGNILFLIAEHPDYPMTDFNYRMVERFKVTIPYGFYKSTWGKTTLNTDFPTYVRTFEYDTSLGQVVEREALKWLYRDFGVDDIFDFCFLARTAPAPYGPSALSLFRDFTGIGKPISDDRDYWLGDASPMCRRLRNMSNMANTTVEGEQIMTRGTEDNPWVHLHELGHYWEVFGKYMDAGKMYPLYTPYLHYPSFVDIGLVDKKNLWQQNYMGPFDASWRDLGDGRICSYKPIDPVRDHPFNLTQYFMGLIPPEDVVNVRIVRMDGDLDPEWVGQSCQGGAYIKEVTIEQIIDALGEREVFTL